MLQDNNRESTQSEAVQEKRICECHYKETERTEKLQAEVKLIVPIGKDKDDNVVTLQEVLEADIKSIEDEVDLGLKKEKLYTNIDKILKEREKEILIRRFGLNGHKPETQNEIAKDLGISRSYVSRIETKAIKKLEAKLKKD